MKEDYAVRSVKFEEVALWLEKKHYLERVPSVMKSFGLFKGAGLEGVATFAKPNNPKLCRGICGDEYFDKVWELNRLCLSENRKNEASILIAGSLRLMVRPSIIVSYASASDGHVGYVYQATNFFYTGCPQNHAVTTWLDGKRFATRNFGTQYGKASDMTSIAAARLKFGDRLKETAPERKHRYVVFLGSRHERAQMRKALKYPVMPYPKGDSTRYEKDIVIPNQMRLI